MTETVILGDILTPTRTGETKTIAQGALAFDDQGVIVKVGEEAQLLKDYPQAEQIDARGHLILPGLIDTHSHISQYPISASSDVPMGEWMQQFVYPTEIEFSNNPEYTKRVSKAFFAEALSLGTTAVATFAVTSTPATEIVFAEAEKAKIRAFIGKVLMDRNALKPLLEDPEEAFTGLEYLLKKWHRPAELEVTVNPRFSVACTENLLKKAGAFAVQNRLILQTHLDYLPSFWPVIKQNFPWAHNAIHLFKEMGCLTSRGIYAHGTGLNAEEYNYIEQNHLPISHCPNSNLYCGMGLLPVRQLIEKNALIGLGTDAGGGPVLSLFEVMRSAGEISKIISAKKETSDWLTVYELLKMATLQGAKMLGIDHVVGTLEEGKHADFIIVDDKSADPLHNQSAAVPFQSFTDRLSRVIYRAHPQLVTHTFIKGKCSFKRSR